MKSGIITGKVAKSRAFATLYLTCLFPVEDEELGAGPAGAPFVDGGAVALEDLDGVVVEGEGAVVRGVYGVCGDHEVEHPAEKLALVAVLLSCTSHSALHVW
jgi:hypothetical protein